MAVGDPAKYPAFTGNVASVETLPCFFPPEKTPGGHGYFYRNSAESYLLIGEAMGKKMVKLSK